MRISKEQLQKIIAEEVRAHVKKKLVTESVSEPRTVKATPAMLKRIIAEEAARVNEMHDEAGRRHPDDEIFHDPKFGRKYSDESYEALQNKWAEDAARDEKERQIALASGKQYFMSDRFHEGLAGGVFYDNGRKVCGLRKSGNDDCAKEVIDYAFKYANDRFHGRPLYLSGLINILLDHELISPAAAKKPLDYIALGSLTKSPDDLDYKK